MCLNIKILTLYLSSFHYFSTFFAKKNVLFTHPTHTILQPTKEIYKKVSKVFRNFFDVAVAVAQKETIPVQNFLLLCSCTSLVVLLPEKWDKSLKGLNLFESVSTEWEKHKLELYSSILFHRTHTHTHITHDVVRELRNFP